jgi:hypothetical protein
VTGPYRRRTGYSCSWAVLGWACVLAALVAFSAFVVHDVHTFLENLFLFFLSFPLVSQPCCRRDNFSLVAVFVPPLSCTHWQHVVLVFPFLGKEGE